MVTCGETWLRAVSHGSTNLEFFCRVLSFMSLNVFETLEIIKTKGLHSKMQIRFFLFLSINHKDARNLNCRKNT